MKCHSRSNPPARSLAFPPHRSLSSGGNHALPRWSPITVVAMFYTEGIFAVDNRCPHMGFPLDRGTVKGCILNCHWHHARFDLNTGGTFDQWADDVRPFPTKIEAGPGAGSMSRAARPPPKSRGPLTRWTGARYPAGDREIDSATGSDDPVDAIEAFRVALEFGSRNRRAGWGSGLTTLVCLANLLAAPPMPRIAPRALFHGITEVASDSRRPAAAIPGACVARCAATERATQTMVPPVHRGARLGRRRTMHRFGRARRRRDRATSPTCSWQRRPIIATSTSDTRSTSLQGVRGTRPRGMGSRGAGTHQPRARLSSGDRMEERNSWRSPIDLVRIWNALSRTARRARKRQGIAPGRPDELDSGSQSFSATIPQPSPLRPAPSIREGCVRPISQAVVVYAAALRLAHFPTSNELGDWDTAHHGFTFANAVHRRAARGSIRQNWCAGSSTLR